MCYYPRFTIREPHVIRDDLKTALVTAMKAGEKDRVATIRLIQAAIKNKDIENRTGEAPADDDVLIADVLRKMAKQRRESIEMYEKGNRPELAAAEAAEVAIIESFLPAQMSAADAEAAVRAIAAEIGATGQKDMGRLMAEVKARLGGQMDMSGASGVAKAVLAG